MDGQAGLNIASIAAPIHYEASSQPNLIAHQAKAIHPSTPAANIALLSLCCHDLEALTYRKLGWERIGTTSPTPDLRGHR